MPRLLLRFGCLFVSTLPPLSVYAHCPVPATPSVNLAGSAQLYLKRTKHFSAIFGLDRDSFRLTTSTGHNFAVSGRPVCDPDNVKFVLSATLASNAFPHRASCRRQALVSSEDLRYEQPCRFLITRDRARSLFVITLQASEPRR